MDRGLFLAACMLCACDARLGLGSPDAAPGSGDGRVQDGPRGPDALMLGAWGTPTPISGASDATLSEDDGTLSSTTNELIFAIADVTIAGSPKDLYTMTRASAADPWSAKQPLATLNTAANEESPRLSLDDLSLYFGRAGDIYVATRATTAAPWGTPTLVPVVSTALYEKWLAVCDNDYFVVSRANGANGQDLYQGKLGVDVGVLASGLNSASGEISTFLSKDCLTIYYASNRAGGTQLYTSTRPTVAGAWAAPTLVTDFGASTDNEDPWMSIDQRTFVFATVRGSATKDLYISTR